MRKIQLAIPFFALILLVPPGIFAQQTNEIDTEKSDNPHILSPDDKIGPVGIVNELREAHNKISTIMHQHAGDYYAVADDLVFSMTYVDEKNQELVVAFDPVMLTLGLYPDAGDVEDLLDSELPVRVEFAKFYPESHIKISQGTINAWINLYNSRCDSPTASSLCKALASNFTKVHYTLDSNNKWQPPSGTTTTTPSTPKPTTPTTPKPTTPTTSTSSKLSGVFTDDFESGLGKWRESGEPDWRADTFDERDIPPGVSSPNKVAEADNCDTGCTLTVARSINISSLSSPVLEFWRYVDNGLDNGEYLKLEVTKNGRTWVTLDTWSHENGQDTDNWEKESYDLKPYKSSSFKLRFVALMSSSGEEVGIDNVVIKNDTDKDRDGIQDSQDKCPTVKGVSALNGCPDRTAPVIKVPANSSHETAGRSANVSFSVTATDNVDSSVVTKCDRIPGLFPIGTTTVTCTATDKAGNKATKSFTITVTKVADSTAPVITIPNNLSYNTIDSAGFTVNYSASASDKIDGKVNVACLPASGSKFPVGTTPVTCVAVDKSGNQATKTFTVKIILKQTQSTTSTPGNNTKTVEFYGGQLIQMSQIASTSPVPQVDNSTITLGVKNDTGYIGLVTAGHGLEIENTTVFDGYYLGKDFLKLVPDQVTIIRTQTADIGFIPLNETNIVVSQDQLYNKTDGTLVTVQHGSTKTTSLDSDIAIFGINNNGIGQLKFRNATIFDSNAKISYTNMAIGTYPSKTGDSGASIVTLNSNTNKLIGVHKGSTCALTDYNQLSISIVNVSTFNHLCKERQVGLLYKVFTPWEHVKEILNLE